MLSNRFSFVIILHFAGMLVAIPGILPAQCPNSLQLLLVRNDSTELVVLTRNHLVEVVTNYHTLSGTLNCISHNELLVDDQIVSLSDIEMLVSVGNKVRISDWAIYPLIYAGYGLSLLGSGIITSNLDFNRPGYEVGPILTGGGIFASGVIMSSFGKKLKKRKKRNPEKSILYSLKDWSLLTATRPETKKVKKLLNR